MATEMVDLAELQEIHDGAHMPFGSGLEYDPPCKWCLVLKELRELRASATMTSARGIGFALRPGPERT